MANTIEVTGEAKVSTAPDQAVITLGAITENISLTAAQTENAKTVSSIIDALLKLNIPQEHIQTTHYSITPQYNYEDGKQIFRNYNVTHLLEITTDNISQTGVIIDAAVNHGANSVSNIQFLVAHPELLYNKALSQAILNSQQKATVVAETLGVTLNTIPQQVQEISQPPGPSPYQPKLYAQSTTTPIQPGELNITAVVKTVYSYYSLG